MMSDPRVQESQFLRCLQRLLSQGDFVIYDKYALLISLTRWAVQHPDHDESRPLHVDRLAPYFAELYWPQVRPSTSRMQVLPPKRVGSLA